MPVVINDHEIISYDTSKLFEMKLATDSTIPEDYDLPYFPTLTEHKFLTSLYRLGKFLDPTKSIILEILMIQIKSLLFLRISLRIISNLGKAVCQLLERYVFGSYYMFDRFSTILTIAPPVSLDSISN